MNPQLFWRVHTGADRAIDQTETLLTGWFCPDHRVEAGSDDPPVRGVDIRLTARINKAAIMESIVVEEIVPAQASESNPESQEA